MNHRVTPFWPLLLFAVAMSASLSAQQVAATGSRADSAITVTASAKPASLVPGETAQISVRVQIDAPYHINATPPTLDYLIPTQVKLVDSVYVQAGKPVYPTGVMKAFAFTGGKRIAVYEGSTEILLPVTVKAAPSAGSLSLQGELSYQACDDNACYPPSSKPFTVELQIGTANSKSELTRPQANATVAQRPSDGDDVRGEDGNMVQRLEAMLRSGRVLAALPLILLLGLLLNLTPCVFPIIPITLAFFGKQSEEHPRRRVALAAVYVSGMALTYAVFGVAAAALGRTFGFQLQNPWVLGTFAVILVALALSLFGLYQIQLPASLRNQSKLRQGFGGALVMGALVGVAAAPCVGPVVVALAALVTASGNLLLGFALFLTLGLGLGLPYLVLATFAGGIKALPQRGEWMIVMEHIFGFLLIGTAIFFLLPLLPPWGGMLLAAYSLAVGIWWNLLDRRAAQVRWFDTVRRVLGLVAIVAALWALRPTTPVTQSVTWQPYSDAAVAAATQAGQPVIIDFRADWCIPCRELESRTFPSPLVAPMLQPYVRLKVDLTRDGDPIATAAAKRFEVTGVPTIVFLRADGTELKGLRLTGFETPERFAERLRRAGAR